MNPTTAFPPYSAFLICFLPLAATIIGFLIAFFITDRHASRPYARFFPGMPIPTVVGGQQLSSPTTLVTETPVGRPRSTESLGEGAIGASGQPTAPPTVAPPGTEATGPEGPQPKEGDPNPQR